MVVIKSLSYVASSGGSSSRKSSYHSIDISMPLASFVLFVKNPDKTSSFAVRILNLGTPSQSLELNNNQYKQRTWPWAL